MALGVMVGCLGVYHAIRYSATFALQGSPFDGCLRDSCKDVVS